MQVNPILTFNGKCEEALEFYRKTLNAEVVTKMRWKDSPDPGMRAAAKGVEDRIMHASFRVGESNLMATDGLNEAGEPEFKGVTLSISVPNEGEAKRLFTVLGEGGKVQMPLARTFWSSAAGMVSDRFGVSWMVNAPA